MDKPGTPRTPEEEGLMLIGQQAAAQNVRLSDERSARVSAATGTLGRSRFAALWLVATAIANSDRRALGGRPSKAAIEAAREAGYVEGLRDAACALLGLGAGELFDSVEAANADVDYSTARGLLHRAPNMVLASHID